MKFDLLFVLVCLHITTSFYNINDQFDLGIPIESDNQSRSFGSKSSLPTAIRGFNDSLIAFLLRLHSKLLQGGAELINFQALIIEKSTELERLRIQHQALLRTEAEQQEVIDQMVLRWFYLWLVVEVVKSEDKVATTLEPRWLRDILRDTDLSLSSILSQPVDREKVDYALQFLLGYKGLLERLIDAARTRDPRTIEVLRDLEQSGGRPVFTQLLPDLSVRQDYFKWSDEDMDILRTQILEINRLIEEFKQVVIDFVHN